MPNYNCPLCNSAMVTRYAKATGNMFYGCGRFPNCSGGRSEKGTPFKSYGAKKTSTTYKAYPKTVNYGHQYAPPVLNLAPVVASTGTAKTTLFDVAPKALKEQARCTQKEAMHAMQNFMAWAFPQLNDYGRFVDLYGQLVYGHTYRCSRGASIRYSGGVFRQSGEYLESDVSIFNSAIYKGVQAVCSLFYTFGQMLERKHKYQNSMQALHSMMKAIADSTRSVWVFIKPARDITGGIYVSSAKSPDKWMKIHSEKLVTPEFQTLRYHAFKWGKREVILGKDEYKLLTQYRMR